MACGTSCGLLEWNERRCGSCGRLVCFGGAWRGHGYILRGEPMRCCLLGRPVTFYFLTRRLLLALQSRLSLEDLPSTSQAGARCTCCLPCSLSSCLSSCIVSSRRPHIRENVVQKRCSARESGGGGGSTRSRASRCSGHPTWLYRYAVKMRTAVLNNRTHPWYLFADAGDHSRLDD